MKVRRYFIIIGLSSLTAILFYLLYLLFPTGVVQLPLYYVVIGTFTMLSAGILVYTTLGLFSKEIVMKVIVRESGTVLAEKAKLTNYFGLMFQPSLKNEEGIYMIKQGIGGVNTFFTRKPIDVIYLDGDEVVDIVQNLKPWKRHKSKLKADVVIELPAGTLERKKVETQQHIEFC